MAFYLVSLPDFPGAQRKNDVKNMVVEADSSTIAKAIAKAKFDGDSDWNSATTTDLSSTSPTDFTGWTYRVRVGGAEAGDPSAADVTYVGIASDTVDLIGAALDTLLSAITATAHAAYNSTTNVLTIAAGGSDALGDRAVLVEVTPPGMSQPLVGMTSTLVHKGVSSDDLKVTLVAPTKIPNIIATLG